MKRSVWRAREEDTVISSTCHVPSSGATISAANGPRSGPNQDARCMLMSIQHPTSQAGVVLQVVRRPFAYCLVKRGCWEVRH